MTAKKSTTAHTCKHCMATFFPWQGRVSPYCSRKCYQLGRVSPIEVRFKNSLGEQLPNGCIPWAGYVANDGYGQFTKTGGQRIPAHRLSYELFSGQPVPGELDVLHRCDNRPCVNPDHLFLGTQKDNMVDMSIKGRSLRGERNPKSKLTAVQVVEIRLRYSAGGISLNGLAREFRMSKRTILDITKRRIWKHVE